MKKIGFFFLFVLGVALTTFAQNPQRPFYNEILGFKKEDSLKPAPANAILFVGSSSFRMWQNVHQAFPEHTIINRGFGGSSLPHVIDYAGEIIFPYNARQIVIYAGENDLAASDTVSAQTVYHRFQQLFYLIRSQQPKTPIVCVSIKPSPSRAHLMPKMEEANRLIQAFIKKQKKTTFVDVYTRMLDGEGKPMPHIFLADNLHMNEQGYAIWKKALKPHLKK